LEELKAQSLQASTELLERYEDKAIIEEGKLIIEPFTTFVEGNYSNTCSLCKKHFKGADKLWFVCPECCEKPVAYPRTPEEESEDAKFQDSIWTDVHFYANDKLCQDFIKLMKEDQFITRKNPIK
jgi:hypothetical protein